MRKWIAVTLLSGALLLVGTGIVVAAASGNMLHAHAGDAFFHGPTHFGPTHTSTEERSFTVVGTPTLSLTGRNGAVTISRGDDDKNVVIRLTKRAGSEEALQRLQVITAQDGDRVTVQERQDYAVFPFGIDTAIDYDIVLPARATVAPVRTMDGPITVSGIAGTLNLDTSNGAVTVHDCDGSIAAHTTNGRVLIADGGGTVHADTTNGMIELRGVRTTNMTLQSANGRIAFTGALAPGADSRIEAANGSVSVALPLDSGFTLDARTAHGSVNVAFPVITVPGGDPPRGDRAAVHGTVGTPNGTLTIRTSNGSITIGKQA